MLLRDLRPSLRLGVVQRHIRHRHARRLDARQHRVPTDVPTRASFDKEEDGGLSSRAHVAADDV
jgi:hypothetical protein